MPEDTYDPASARATAEAYDTEAQATDYLAPQIAFDLVSEHLQPGQSVLDLGIGTGLASAPFREAGLAVHGMDISQEMLDACRWKGYGDLKRHDLTRRPYPYDSESFDYVLCVGVLPFLRDPSPVFLEAGRVLKADGILVVLTLDRTDQEAAEQVVGPEDTGTGEAVTLYRHTRGQVGGWLEEPGFILLKSRAILVHRDSTKSASMRATCLMARRVLPSACSESHPSLHSSGGRHATGRDAG